MNQPNRKPPEKVRAIKGNFQPDVVTKAELEEAASLQATAWLAERNAREYVQRIEHRLMSGAKLEDCEYEFDPDLQMVRSKKGKATG